MEVELLDLWSGCSSDRLVIDKPRGLPPVVIKDETRVVVSLGRS